MARRGKGVGGGNRIALRGFSRLLGHLPPEARDRIESAFVEAEDLIDFHARSVPTRQTRRRLSGALESPTLTVDNSVIGGSVSWTRSNDPRVSMYELQTDDVNVFPNPETFTILDTFFSIENINAKKFVRVRNVRIDGQVGNWSNTGTIDPNSIAPRVDSYVFYQGYSHSEPDLRHELASYAGEPTPRFYTIATHTFYPGRTAGGMTVYGYISNRLKEYAEGNIRPWDRVRFSINGITRAENDYCHWTDAFGDEDTDNVLPDGTPTSFYGRGGYVANFGPYLVSYPATLRGEGLKDGRRVLNIDAGTNFYWADTLNARVPAKWDDSLLEDISADSAHEATVTLGGLENDEDPTIGDSSSYLAFKDFGFNVPSTATVTGIQAAVKRRQQVPSNDSFVPDFGVSPPLLMPLTTDLDVYTIAGINERIRTDVDRGRYLNLGDDASDDTEYPVFTEGFYSPGIDDKFSLSLWVRLNVPSVSVGNHAVFSLGNPSVSGNLSTFNLEMREGIGGLQTIRNIIRFENNSGSVKSWPSALSVGFWYHLVLIYDNTVSPTADRLKLYIDSVETDPSSPFSNSSDFSATRRRRIGIKGLGGVIPTGAYDISQVALWDSVLDQDEIDALFASSFRADYRRDGGGYQSSANLKHYWLLLPEDSRIRDYEIRLIDSLGTIRSDIQNKATTENWPVLSDYINTNQFFYGLPIAVGEGPVHDSVLGYGYQLYGGSEDLWGAENDDGGFYSVLLSPASINSKDFGLAVRAANQQNHFPGTGLIDHAAMAVFWQDPLGGSVVDLKVEGRALNRFYLLREVFGGTFNMIETGG